MVDDRPQLRALSIANNEIFLDAVIHGIDEPMCCPTMRTTRHYRLVDNQLDMIDYTTFTPDGKPRTIMIEALRMAPMYSRPFRSKERLRLRLSRITWYPHL
jgi:hypothetical protein